MAEQKASARIDVLLAGSYDCSLAFTHLKEMPAYGREIFSDTFAFFPGGTFITAQALQRLEVKAAWSTDFGNDFFSQSALKAARREGLSETLFRLHDHPVYSVSARLTLPQGQQTRLSYHAPLEEAPFLQEVLTYYPRFLLVSEPPEWKDRAHIFEIAHQQGAQVYLSLNNAIAWEGATLAERLRGVDILALEDSTACRLTGEPQPETALSDLAQAVPLVIIRSEKQATLAQSGSQVFRVPAQASNGPFAEAFDAGFLYGSLQGQCIEHCLHYGMICGELSTITQDSLATPTRQQVEKLFTQANPSKEPKEI